jgi:hypothetical protein
MKIKPFGLNVAVETRHATSLQYRGGGFNNRNYKQMKKCMPLLCDPEGVELKHNIVFL